MDGGNTQSPLTIAAIASAAAAVLHAAAAGIHAEHVGLSRLFIALAVAQAAAAVAGFVSTGRLACGALGVVNLGAVSGWLFTRLAGIAAIGGLEVAERPQLADTTAAALALVAVVAAATCLGRTASVVPNRAVANAAVLAGVLLVPGLADATTHTSHDASHDADAADHAGDDHANDDHANDDHANDDQAAADHANDDHDDHDVDDTSWPRAWDPSGPIDFSGVDGVTAEQQARAEQLVVDTLRELPVFADVTTVEALGYRSIGDASTGHEHYINRALIADDKFLDPTAPESLVYEVDGDERTLVSAMFIAEQTPIDSPELIDFGGPLMQWHVHDNLCWGVGDDGVPVVRGVLEDFGGSCPSGTVNAGGENPMVHVWIAPHECGPFAALEGQGAGQTAVSETERVDTCQHDHGDGDHDDHDDHDDHGGDAAVETAPYDPELPIDLGGIDGVTPQQQAFAENLVAATLSDLPKWSDLDVVEAAGFRSIGDGGTGHEHYIQWDWIDDDVWLDPDFPESLVFEPQPDGSKELVSAMFMLPTTIALDEVPDWGGALMQWHVHGDLCFTDDPVAPQVAGTKPLGSTCREPLVDGPLAPMIHVWIRSHECGPFAALDGIGGGQVPEGEEVLCDTAHGSH